MKRCMGCMDIYEDHLSSCPYCAYQADSQPQESFHLEPGTKIADRYIVGKVLGFGGFGITYIGWDEVLETKVAIKEYLPSEFATRIPSQTRISVYSGDKTIQFGQGMQRFVEEAQKLAKFGADSEIVSVYNCITENDTAYIIMELLEGESLKSYLDREGKMPVEKAEQILLSILRSLTFIHAENIIHRDIAPDNIFLTKDGRIKLLDFGAARYASTSHSRSLSVIYKPGYAPEEQYQSHGEQGPWTDIYSLAATFYRMVTGVTPDPSLERQVHDTLQPLSKYKVNLPRNKEHALMNALNVRVADRTKSAQQFLDEWNSQGDVKRILSKVKKMDSGALGVGWRIGLILSILVLAGAIVVTVVSTRSKEVHNIELAEGEIRVPSVVNSTISNAQTMAEKLGIRIEIIDREYSSQIEKDFILKQELESGSIMNRGEVLNVIVSGGIRQILMPNIVGHASDDAKKELQKEGFKVKVEEVYSAVVEGHVERTSLETGTTWDEGTEVIMYVSKGIDPSTIVVEDPTYTLEDYTNKLYTDIMDELKKAGISVSPVSEYHPTIPENYIIRQDMPAGSELKVGDSITLVYSLGKEMITIPEDVTNKPREYAEAVFKDLDVKLNFVPDYNDVVAVGHIISSSVTVHEEVEPGSEITLFVSLGPAATATPSPTPSPTPAPTNTPKPTPTKKPKATSTPKPTATPKPTNTPKPTATPKPSYATTYNGKVVDIMKAEPGDSVKFGKYVFGLVTVYEDLTWLVLEEKDGKLLLLCEQLIEPKMFNSDFEADNWRNSSLRAWLNDEFYKEAFQDNSFAIISTKNETADNSKYGTDSGIASDDFVFILSAEEAEKYFKSNSDRRAYTTERAQAYDAYTSSNGANAGCGRWWLRTMGKNSSYGAYVSDYGAINLEGLAINSNGVCIRPAIWVNKSLLK